MPSREKNRRPQHKSSHISSPPFPPTSPSNPKPQTIFSDVRTGWPKSAFTFTHLIEPNTTHKWYMIDIGTKIHTSYDLYPHHFSSENFDYGPTLLLDSTEKPLHPLSRKLKHTTPSTIRNVCTECPSGPTPFPTRRDLARHIESTHRCPSCHWHFPTIEDQRNHTLSKHTPSTLLRPAQFPFTCCGQVFTRFSDPSLAQHRWNSHGTSRRPDLTPLLPFGGKGYRCRFLTCHRANNCFRLKTELGEHVAAEHAICRPCDKKFRDVKTLLQHLRQSPRHVDDTEMRCLDCDASFDVNQDLAEHVCRITCEDSGCSFVAGSRSALEEHQVKRKHGPFTRTKLERSLKCPGCERMFKTPGGVVAHLESGGCGSGINRKVMELAVSRFDMGGLIHDEDKLREVMKIEGERMKTGLILAAVKTGAEQTWPCGECGKGFREEKSLRMHLESPVHREKAFHCPGDGGDSGSGAVKGGMIVDDEETIGDANETETVELESEEQGKGVAFSESANHPHRRFKTLSGLATHIERSESVTKAEYGSRMLLAAIEMVADRMDALELDGESAGILSVPM